MIKKEDIEKCYEIAKKARSLNYDPTDSPDIVLAPDLAARVEGIVGPKGVAERIRKTKGDRVTVAFKIAEDILNGEIDVHDELDEFNESGKKVKNPSFNFNARERIDTREKIIEQAIRTGTAILTEGVLVAPTEGISGVKIKRNADGTEYLSVLYAGPIRAAGGTSAALSVLLADFARRKMNIIEFRPTDTAIERYTEEVNLYDMRGARLQYKPNDEGIKWLIKNCPICIDGEPTEKFEVSVHRDVIGIDTNRIRGGMCLVLCEGLAQKATKVKAIAKKLGIDWGWLDNLIKVPKKSEKETSKPESSDKFLDEVVAGRPIFSYPSTFGGFRLRYGRTRITGIAAKAIHPATMIILDGFPAIGTQLRIERPGKGCVVSPCDSIEGPIVKLEDGSVVKINSVEDAIKFKDQINKILFLGDLLITYGDFLKTGTPLFPAGYCEEWWVKEFEKAKNERNSNIKPEVKNAEEAFRISEDLKIPLHPKYTYFWKNINGKQIKELINWLKDAKFSYEWLKLKDINVVYNPAKYLLEKILMPHKIEKDLVIIDSQDAYTLMRVLDLFGKKDPKHIEELINKINDEENGLEVINKISKVTIREKSGTWIGSRMGRPEKSRERLMKPAPHILFPIGWHGGKTRNLIRAYKQEKNNNEKPSIEIARMKCENPECGNITFMRKCEKCGSKTHSRYICPTCGVVIDERIHTKCGSKTLPYDERVINFAENFEKAMKRCGYNPAILKGVIGMTNDAKLPEIFEKGILREKHKIFVFKDGTSRFDATMMPITHFYPREIALSAEDVKRLGYTTDINGKEIKNEDQLIEIHPQDLIVSERCLNYLYRISNFIDDLLTKVYGQNPFYNAKEERDILGQLTIMLSPHTSCGIASRVIGITKAHVCYAHPYMISATRRNCFTGNTFMCYENAGETHVKSIEEMFNDYYKIRDPIIVDKFRTELIDLSDRGVCVFGTDTKGNFEKKKIKNIIRQPYKGKILKITAENNQELSVTPSHPLWIYNLKTKRLEKKYASELKENDLLSGLGKVKMAKNNLQYLDLVEIFKSDPEVENITVRTSKEFCRRIIKEFGGWRKVAEKLGITKMQTRNILYRKPYGVPLKQYIKIRYLVGKKEEKEFRLGLKYNFADIPLHIHIDEYFMKLLGYYISEGCGWISKTSKKESYHIGIAASDPEVRKDIIKCIEALNLSYYVYKDTSVTITNKLFHKLLLEKLKIGKGAYTKNIPDFCFNQSNKNIFSFLSGMYQGDGSIYGREIKYCTVSETLASQLYTLLTASGFLPTFKIERNKKIKTGIVFEEYTKKGKKPPSPTLHYVSIYSKDTELFASTIHLIGEKGKRLDQIMNVDCNRRKIKTQNDIRILKIKSIEEQNYEGYVYDLEIERPSDKIFGAGKGMILSHNCDGDENTVMLLMDGLINFSKEFLPSSRGGTMDAPLILMLNINPTEVDDEVHAMEVCKSYPLEFYESSINFIPASEVNIEKVLERLGKENETKDLLFTHPTKSINEGVTITRYVTLKSMKDKIDAQLELGKKIEAVDENDAAERIILSHFLPDIYGNLRSFCRQQFRCADCGAKYRRVPLSGKCRKCGGKLLLTIHRGGVEKYLKISQNLAKEYESPDYLKQRLILLERDIKSLFEDETVHQFNLAEFM